MSLSIVVRVTMDLFQHRYYRLSKTLMTLVGHWPYQSIRARRSLPAVSVVIITGQVIPEILAAVKYRNNTKIVLECIISFLFVTICVTKLISFLWNSQKTCKLLNRIRTDWKVWAHDREVNILHEYAEQGEHTITMYTATIYSTTFLFLAQPVTPKIIDTLLKNGTEPGTFPIPVDYHHIDTQKYYFYIFMYTCLCVYVCVTILVASDVMLITHVQHVCGFFAALGSVNGHKLERIGTNNTSMKKGERSYALNKRNMFDLASYINKHNDAIEYARLIEATYKWSFFFIVGLGMIMMIAIGLEIILKSRDSEATIRFIAYGMTGLLHFYVECYISQILMDHSIAIYFYIHNSQWYRLSPKAQKLVQLLTMRCGVPCHLTAGNFFIMSMRTFGQTVRTGLSYLAVARTMQI